MKILIKAADNKYLFVVFHRLGPEELLWFLEAALVHSQNDVALCIEVEAVADPAVVTTKY